MRDLEQLVRNLSVSAQVLETIWPANSRRSKTLFFELDPKLPHPTTATATASGGNDGAVAVPVPVFSD